jgi:hypothetical protein
MTFLKFLTRHRHLAITSALVALTLFGALVQSGILAPNFRQLGTGGQLGTASVTGNLENVSWRSWTMTGIHLTDPRSPVVLPDKSTVTIGPVYLGQPWITGGKLARPGAFPLVVRPGQQVFVTLVRAHLKNCGQPTNSVVHPDGYNVPIDLAFSTPIGTRTVVATLVVDYGCPHS